MQPQLTDTLRASWQRCVNDYGLGVSLHRDVERVSDHELRALTSDFEEIVRRSETVLDQARKLARTTNQVVLIGNGDGVVVKSYADSVASEEIRIEGLDRGSVWQEQAVGTNGIGTAIASRSGVTVFGPAHYNEKFRRYSCSAAPILGAGGNVIGAFDMSTRADVDLATRAFSHHFARKAAAEISNVLFCNRNKYNCVVTLSSRRGPAPSLSSGMIALDDAGHVLEIAPRALEILDVKDATSVIGRDITEVLQIDPKDLQPVRGKSVRIKVDDASKTYATVYLPAKAQAVRSKSATAIKTPVPEAAKPLDQIAGQDPAAQLCVQICRNTADKDIPILILGETGTGKDTLARAIHHESNRAHKPFVAINCAAIPETLLASELFGYEAGTFTGAAKNGRVGKIASANGGTLFLDEIGDMPFAFQAHLLRVLEQRIVTPLGSTREIPIDIKLICATNLDLLELISAGRFRSDLYYRIQGAQVTLPSLRRRQDFDALVQRIYRDEIGGLDDAEMSKELVATLRSYPWPGNLRELRNVIRFTVSAAEDFDLHRGCPPDALLAYCGLDKSSDRSERPCPTTLVGSKAVSERQRIVDALRARSWNITAAARDLAVSRATLHRKIRKHGIVSPNNEDGDA